MKLIKHATLIAALSVAATLSYTHSAQAFSFKMTTGVNGPNNETNQGAYSEFAKLKGTTTIDFNSGKAPTTGMAKYSFQKNTGSSSVRADKWAPAGAKGEVNTTNYLAVFKDNDVTINLQKSLNYFGIDWGAISGGNVFSFFKGNQLVKSYSTADVNPLAPIKAKQHGGEGNGYLHFYADSAADIFDKIVISQKGGGGFESDNHSFHEGTGKFDFDNPQSVPEPGMVLGLLAIGGAAVRKRNLQKTA
jgi:hypothetical protein